MKVRGESGIEDSVREPEDDEDVLEITEREVQHVDRAEVQNLDQLYGMVIALSSILGREGEASWYLFIRLWNGKHVLVRGVMIPKKIPFGYQVNANKFRLFPQIRRDLAHLVRSGKSVITATPYKSVGGRICLKWERVKIVPAKGAAKPTDV